MKTFRLCINLYIDSFSASTNTVALMQLLSNYYLLSVNLILHILLLLAKFWLNLTYIVKNYEKNAWMCVCFFYEQSQSQHQIKLCYPEYSCEHAPVLECAVGCFPWTWSMFLSSSWQNRCAHLWHLWLAKVKLTLQSFLLHLLRCFYFILNFI